VPPHRKNPAHAPDAGQKADISEIEMLFFCWQNALLSDGKMLLFLLVLAKVLVISLMDMLVFLATVMQVRLCKMCKCLSFCCF